MPPSQVAQYRGLPVIRVRVVDDPVPLQVLPGMCHVGLPVILLKGQYCEYYLLSNLNRIAHCFGADCQLGAVDGDREELQALVGSARPLLDAQHHLDEYAESIRIKMKRSAIEIGYRSPERLKYSF